MSGPYKVVIEQEPCGQCGQNGRFEVIDAEGIGSGVMWHDFESAKDDAEEKNRIWCEAKEQTLDSVAEKLKAAGFQGADELLAGLREKEVQASITFNAEPHAIAASLASGGALAGVVGKVEHVVVDEERQVSSHVQKEGTWQTP